MTNYLLQTINSFREIECTCEFHIIDNGLKKGYINVIFYNKKYIIASDLGIYAAKTLDFPLIKYCLANKQSGLLEGACQGGHLPLIRYLITISDVKPVCVINNLCIGGHLDLIKYFLEYFKPVPNWDLWLSCASLGGNRDVIDYIMQNGRDLDLDQGLYGAAEGGHLHLVEFFISKGATDFEYGLYSSIDKNCHHLINFFIEKLRSAKKVEEKDYINEALTYAVSNCDYKLVKLFISMGGSLSEDNFQWLDPAECPLIQEELRNRFK